MINEYQVGVVSIEAGSDIVTGHGTSWLTYSKAGDQLIVAGQNCLIAEVIDVASLRLTTPFPGSTATQIRYRILINQE